MTDPNETRLPPSGWQNSPDFEVIPPDLPQQIERYRVVSVLGEGEFARVSFAHDDELNSPAAIKVPRREPISSLEDAGDHLAEAHMIASLDHPHIVSVLDEGRIDPRWAVLRRLEVHSGQRRRFGIET